MRTSSPCSLSGPGSSTLRDDPLQYGPENLRIATPDEILILPRVLFDLDPIAEHREMDNLL